MVQISEVLSLIFDSLGLIIIIALYRGGIIPHYRYLFFGFACIWASDVCTVAEGFIWYDFFNLAEHISFLSAVLFFCLGFFAHFRKAGAGLP